MAGGRGTRRGRGTALTSATSLKAALADSRWTPAGNGARPRRRGGGREAEDDTQGRSWVDWIIVAAASGGFLVVALGAARPQIAFNVGWAALLSLVLVASAVVAGLRLWRAGDLPATRRRPQCLS